MRIIVEAIFDGNMWDGFLKPRRTQQHADILLEERPNIGDTVTGRLAELVDPDPYEARRKLAADSFGDEAYLVVGKRAPAGRP